MATFTLDHGPLGREAAHSFVLNGSPIFTLGDLAAWPRYIIDNVVGIGSLPDADDNRAEKTGRIGELALPSMPRGKTITYALRVCGRTLPEFRQGMSILRGVFHERSILREMRIAPAGEHDGQVWTYQARTQALTEGDEQFGAGLQPAPWQQAVTLSLRLMDPRIYPYGLAPVTADIAEGASATMTNQGTAAIDPVLTFHGPTTTDGPQATNVTASRTITFPGLALASGEDLVVDFAARTARKPDGTDLMRYLDAAGSDWWFEGADSIKGGPSDTTIRADRGALTVTFTPGWW